MAWVKGQSGNPTGKAPNSMIVRDMLMLAAMVDDRKKTTRLRKMADKVMNEACKGKQWAVNFVADRIDGKVPQPIQQTIDGQITTTQVFLDLYQRVSNGEFDRRSTDPMQIVDRSKEPEGVRAKED